LPTSFDFIAHILKHIQLLGKLTAVQWFWLGDQNNWCAFDNASCSLLESEYLKGTSKVKLDSLRFVDLSLGHEEVLSNFKKLEDDRNIIGIQRRYDDEMKRRAVKRIAPEFFSKDNFMLLSKMNRKSRKEFIKLLESYGAVVSSNFNNKITVVLCEENQLSSSFEMDVLKAIESSIPVVSLTFVEKSIEAKRRLDTKEFELKFPNDKVKKRRLEKDIQENENESISSNSSNYNSGFDELRNDSGPMGTSGIGNINSTGSDENAHSGTIKKAKLDKRGKRTITNNSNRNESTISKQNNTENHIDDIALNYSSHAITIPLTDMVFKGAPDLKSSTEWMGLCTMESDGSSFPFVMTINKRVINSFSGEMHWPTLNSAKTRFRGDICGEDIKIEEYEVIQGADEVEIPMHYRGKIKGNTITGSSEDSRNARTFTLNKVTAKLAKELDVLKAKSKWQGVAYHPYPFELEITQRKGIRVEGLLTWPTLNDMCTRVRGIIEGETFQFEEFESESRSNGNNNSSDRVELPCNYTGLYINKRIAGNFGCKNFNGLFDIKLE